MFYRHFFVRHSGFERGRRSRPRQICAAMESGRRSGLVRHLGGGTAWAWDGRPLRPLGPGHPLYFLIFVQKICMS